MRALARIVLGTTLALLVLLLFASAVLAEWSGELRAGRARAAQVGDEDLDANVDELDPADDGLLPQEAMT